jgi:hypothetical protein
MKFQAACAALSSTQNPNSVQHWALHIRMSIFKMMQTTAQSKPPSPKTPKNQSTVITLIRPKGVTLPPPTPKPKKPKRKPEYLLDSHPRIKRSRSVMLPPRNIQTPDWCDANPDSVEAVAVGPFDIVAVHRALEICESRIQRGEDPAHRHPVLASKASPDDRELSQKEKEMGERYDEVKIGEMTPTFWPKRIWDSPETQMGEAETQKLSQKIEEAGAEGGRVRKTVSPAPKRAGRVKRIERGNEPTVVAIDLKNYETDDEETDWDDF